MLSSSSNLTSLLGSLSKFAKCSGYRSVKNKCSFGSLRSYSCFCPRTLSSPGSYAHRNLNKIKDSVIIPKRSWRSRVQPKEKTDSGKNFGLLKPLAFTVLVSSGTWFSLVCLDEYTRLFFTPVIKADLKVKQNLYILVSSDMARAVILAACGAVFLAWNVLPNSALLARYFTSMPGNPVLGQIGSVFSHSNLLHFFVNMYVAWSFVPCVAEHVQGVHFWSFVVSAGLWSSFASLCFKSSMRLMVPSLGFSGVLMGFIGLLATKSPEIRVAIFPLNFVFDHSFTIQHAAMALAVFDGACLLFRFRTPFDHAAHLGGLVFGVLYAMYGLPLWREVVIELRKERVKKLEKEV